MRTAKLFGIVLLACLLADLCWLGLLMGRFYSRELGDLARREGDALAPRWWAAGWVYVLIPFGLVLFVRPRVAAPCTALAAGLWGAAFGLVLYGVYDLSNLAVLEKWTVRLTVADIVWGCVLCGGLSALIRIVDARNGNA